MSTQPLIRVSCLSQNEHIGLVAYADLIVHDKEHNIVALRIGGYPEAVQGMSDAILGGCDLELQGSKKNIRVSSKGKFNYERSITHDGIYAEAMHCLKDEASQSFIIGNDSERSDKETVKANRNLYFFCANDEELYAELDRKLSVPLLPEFQSFFLRELKQRGLLRALQVYSLGKSFDGWQMRVSADEKELVAILEDGLKSGQIVIPGASKSAEFPFHEIQTFTGYLKQFGAEIAGRIKQCFPPRFNPMEEPISSELLEVNQYVHKHAGYSLFDAQLGAAEALKRQLEHDKMALLVAECGTGKTKIGSSALYAYQRGNPKRKCSKKAFNVVLCPSHITDKWVRELQETIPNCFAKHISTMADVDQLYLIYQQENKTVYCILSKETARNGYMRKPVVTWNRVKKGFLCPYCGGVQEMSVFDEDTKYTVNADAEFFLNENSKNHKCQFCKHPLWGMLNPNDLSPRRNEWVRIGGYGFVHRQFAQQLLSVCKNKEHHAKIREIAENPIGIFPAPGALSRYPLSTYISTRYGESTLSS